MGRTIVQRVYHVRNEDEDKIEYINMKSIGFSDQNKKEKYNGLMACYHLHFDKDLGIGKAAVRRIPCNCDACYKVKY